MEDSKVRNLVDYKLRATNQSRQPGMNSSPPSVSPKPKLLEQVRQAIRTRHYSYKTDEAYVGWIAPPGGDE
ncbi:MAG: hypothetical protein HYY45_04540 [Deltaproteobacteria bacterium]|nr:hypothetical protein [Deltaproteobacteria bacterium]